MQNPDRGTAEWSSALPDPHTLSVLDQMEMGGSRLPPRCQPEAVPGRPRTRLPQSEV